MMDLWAKEGNCHSDTAPSKASVVGFIRPICMVDVV